MQTLYGRIASNIPVFTSVVYLFFFPGFAYFLYGIYMRFCMYINCLPFIFYDFSMFRFCCSGANNNKHYTEITILKSKDNILYENSKNR